MSHRENRSGDKSTKVTSPHGLEGEIVGHFLWTVSSPFDPPGGKVFQTSRENRTPPMGLPNATATPAAAHALRISLVFPACL